MTTTLTHRPVLLEEVLEALSVHAQGIYIDGTYGRGGHAREVLRRLGPDGRLLAVDKDPAAVAAARAEWDGDARVAVEQGSFADIARYVAARGWQGKVTGVLLDLGVSSPQLDDAQRGFSFRAEGPLDMRMNPDVGQSAAAWLNTAEQAEIARVLREYGEERYAGRIARAIVQRRAEQPLATTRELAALVAAAVPTRERSKDPATRTFQALRIQVNGELADLETFLRHVLEVLAPGGRLAVISFHSLEDRLVKRFLQDEARGDHFPPDLPVPASALQPRVRLLGRAQRARDAEVRDNPRARSAVLRVAEKL
ncbi:16S rRNA (cytosine(1402)-N(4))-methyltransferase RsmH [Ectothiorhodospiraceae bacterium 2226]|nr:16S rRNA (cytosine(1402)-N(4))-methyltransferase RsmH [Ectothiorhodospiraceae bacterium 2226]